MDDELKKNCELLKAGLADELDRLQVAANELVARTKPKTTFEDREGDRAKNSNEMPGLSASKLSGGCDAGFPPAAVSLSLKGSLRTFILVSD